MGQKFAEGLYLKKHTVQYNLVHACSEERVTLLSYPTPL